MREDHVSASKIGVALGRSTESIHCKFKQWSKAAKREKSNEPRPSGNASTGPSLERDESAQGTIVTSRSKTVKTVKELLKVAEVDLDIWEVERFIENKWDMVAKITSRSRDDYLEATELWQVKVWFRRRVPKTIAEAAEGIMARMRKHSPKYPKPPKLVKSKDPHLCEISIWDHHFGKLAWARETGEDYDLKIAERIYQQAGDELLKRSSSFHIEKFVMAIGQDFFHVDGWQNTTTSGTPQDVDGRLAKIFETGQMALVRLIDLMMQRAPVHIFYLPGNHDYYTSWYLTKTLEAWYRTSDRVTVDTSECPRKHVHYGCNLIGYSHGSDEKHQSLPMIMATQWPEAWAKSTNREWHVGHLHRAKETKFTTVDNVDQVAVRVLPSATGTDLWHFKKGYVGGMRAAQAYFYSPTQGYVAHFNANVRS